ncbi:Gfo/Idh/MocA family protein [Aggregatilinea lenta]|uniref:Gfo/Idh/MocA family protein n=1 Tax=Aggregatilinea lenta TaxID=913108 RepID=UPI0013C3393F|nr:Gfo/Idh/MocA family oxidoreductase [Aggregatilinea lenta]
MGDQSRGDVLRVALVGTGFGARVQLPAFMGLAGTSVAALCGRSAEKTQRIADEHGVPGAYTDYRRMLDEVKPDIVSIVTPPVLHAEMTLAAFEAGAHVLCEKPLAMNAAEVQQMLDAAQRRNRVHVVDHEFRYFPARYYQRVLVDQGYVGQPVLLEATFMSPVRWNPAHPWTWWYDAAQGGGLWGAIGSHYVDAFHWLRGRDPRAVTAMLSTSPRYATRPAPDGNGTLPVTADDSAVVTIEYASGLRGVINLCAVAAGESRRLAVHGTEGALVVEDELRLLGRRGDEALHEIPIPPEYEPPMWVPEGVLNLGPFAKLAGLMVDAIHGHAVVQPPTFEDGLIVQRVLDAARQSSAEGRRVEIV